MVQRDRGLSSADHSLRGGTTDYHAQFIAYELTRRLPADSDERLTGALVDAQVDLNPHQIEAALFAFKSPLSTGALLADEVGLGKTIEAGLVLSQHWAERRRRILVITPANLRKQWLQEITEKFFLPCFIMEAKPYNAAIRTGNFQPFERDDIVICSYQFARSKAPDVQRIPWDLVVMDEAHRMRNVYRPSNVVANTLKLALAGRKKLLLTATPLQNSLLELFGLMSFIDEYAFGDLDSFKDQYASVRQAAVYDELKERLKPMCHRTLRRQVRAYVRYTERLPLVEHFTPDEAEDRLYTLVSEYLRRPNLQALPNSQRSLTTMVLRKLLASSTHAIAGALDTLATRLERKLAKSRPPEESLEEELTEDFEGLDETADEWDDDADEPLSEADQQALEREIAELREFTNLALSVEDNAKGRALLVALERAFEEAERLGAPRKAIIFTESKRTQNYLLRLLRNSQFKEGLVLFNGSNTDELSRAIYAEWQLQNIGSDRMTGSRTADMRSAIVDYFRDQGQIMIATEAGAEGINLQFCSLVVNYDLPWNPQRIEQRIGRCHRYGQQHDVVVVNFLNQNNAADQRVYELLSVKFKLFEGVFGASDEVLGAIESGVDLEKRIADIYQKARLPEEIQAAFDQLQLELSAEIDVAMTRTRQQLLENFDDEVADKLRARDEASRDYLNRYERLLMRLTRHELDGHARFDGDGAFVLDTVPFPGEIPLGRYELPRRSGKAHLYRLNHPLAEALVEQARGRRLHPASISFDYGAYEGRISALEPYIGRSGWLEFSVLTMKGLESAEDHLIAAALTDEGEALEADIAVRMLNVPGILDGNDAGLSEATRARLSELAEAEQRSIIGLATERNNHYFEQEMTKLDAWAKDKRVSLRQDMKRFDNDIDAARKQARAAGNLPEKLALQRKINQLESRRDEAELAFRMASKEIKTQRDKVLDDVESRLQQTTNRTVLFTIKWRLQ